MADWIDLFMQETDGINSPPLIRKWGAIAAVSGAMERKVWVVSKRAKVFPNTYIIIVAPSAGGKTEVTKKVRKLWLGLKKHNIASSSVTRASFIDELTEAKRIVTRLGEDPPQLEFNSLLFCSNELGVLLPAYDTEFMATLTDLYDCIGYSETRRSMKEPIDIPSPHVSFIAACTPSYLKDTLPEGAWEQGFISRSFLVFSGEKMPIIVDLERQGYVDLNGEIEKKEDRLQDELQKIANMTGKMQFSDAAIETFKRWVLNGQEPLPEHPKLIGYTHRRYIHLVKLSMIACASATQSLLVEEDHVLRALDWMVEIETLMPDIFRMMASGGDNNVIKDTWYFVYEAYNKSGKKPIAESRVWTFIQGQTSSYNVPNILASMERAGLLKKGLGRNGTEYTPGRGPQK